MTITKTLVIAAYIALAVVLIALNLWWVLLLIGFAALLMRSEDRATKAHTPPADMITANLPNTPHAKNSGTVSGSFIRPRSIHSIGGSSHQRPRTFSCHIVGARYRRPHNPWSQRCHTSRCPRGLHDFGGIVLSTPIPRNVTAAPIRVGRIVANVSVSGGAQRRAWRWATSFP
jgi:hypothetical protein